MQRRVPRDRAIELADTERDAAGVCSSFAPHRAPRHARSGILAIDVEAVQAAALERAADGFEMREQARVLDDHRKRFGHEDCGIEAALRQREVFDWPAVEAKLGECVNLVEMKNLAQPLRNRRGNSAPPQFGQAGIDEISVGLL